MQTLLHFQLYAAKGETRPTGHFAWRWYSLVANAIAVLFALLLLVGISLGRTTDDPRSQLYPLFAFPVILLIAWLVFEMARRREKLLIHMLMDLLEARVAPKI